MPDSVIETWNLAARLVPAELKITGVPARDLTLRLLDTECADGQGLQLLAQTINHRARTQVETFGIEHRQQHARPAQENLDNFVQARFRDTHISHEAFSVILLNDPPPGRPYEDHLRQAANYLDANGFILFEANAAAISASGYYLCRNANVEIFHHSENTRHTKDTRYLLRIQKRVKASYSSRIMQHCAEPEHAAAAIGTRAWPVYPVPRGELLFSARRLDLSAAAHEARARGAGAWFTPTLEQRLWPTEPRTLNPLLPLRQVHIGLLTASGFLDNLELTSANRRVLVKGRTIKSRVLVAKNEQEEVWQDKIKTSINILDLRTGEVEAIQA